ncbi:MAG TPA: alpha/beta hydrolase [Candidatus Galloscillospira stercoripullorum]|nr:alpha/beta hydrolase [Candidatus Galloscillospira stercoripullorum]
MSYFTFEGKQIYYEIHGEGKPFIVLNGIMMSTASWKAFVPAFSAANQLILMDFLDQGQSERMTGEYSQGIQAEVVLALMDHLGLEKATVMGISYGSEVALRFAVKYPERLERLELFNVTARTGAWLQDIGDGWNLAARNCGEAYYLTTIPVIYSPEFYIKQKEWMAHRREVLTPVFGNPAFYEAMIRLTNSSRDYDVSDQLHKITVPTLVVSCENDYLIPMPEQRFLAEHIPNCEYVVIPNCGHASMYEKPMLFASLALGFLNNPTTEYPIG